MSSDRLWLTALWPKVRSYLPPAPAVVLEMGCGRLGGFVPALNEAGYQALGVDPAAPEGESYRRIEFERSDVPGDANAVVACTSMHHVADPAQVLDTIAGKLVPGGLVIVVEWDWESFDEATARWGFERLDAEESSGWLAGRREHWRASGLPWEGYLQGWAAEHGLHGAGGLVRQLDERFERLTCERGAYLFPDLAGTTEADELSAIDAGEVRATRIDYVGRAP
jgi:SAM-dependent methyltransferase